MRTIQLRAILLFLSLALGAGFLMGCGGGGGTSTTCSWDSSKWDNCTMGP